MPDSISVDSPPGFAPEAFERYAYPRTLDPRMVEILAQQRAAAAPVDRYALPFDQARALLLQERRKSQTGVPRMLAIEDAELQVNGRRVGLRWYRPQASRDAVPIVYLHGGGWCVGSNETHDTVLRHLAAGSGLPVCGVDYSLAPEHPFPAALADVAGAVDAVLAQHGRVVLAGDSAGANLALVEAMRRRDARPAAGDADADGIAGLILFYGVFGPMRSGGSFGAYGSGEFGLSCAAQQRYLDAYLSGASNTDDPRAFPLLGELGGLSPALILAAGLDLLLDDSVRMHHAIVAAGGRSTLSVAHGVPHGFLNHANALPRAAQALAEAASFARSLIERRPAQS
ncbi:Acetyl esterase [Variovorax sp. SRS16]|uniref:alpha/beta hydrolase fold domain-containing protein n=1 Tax=Variovorax sp. SRS16 TaxID=282217 RepID=UPI001316E4AD|nr:alpha/beta hydrolase fold domain-containing protein [Variovorax sp. SRS16]VTU15942.1 Acetyl esterase [Variovorax sp. SRS16]